MILERDYGAPKIVNSGKRKIRVEDALHATGAAVGEGIVLGGGVVLHTVDENTGHAFGYNAATRDYSDLLAMGVIDPAKVTRLALQNAGSIASLILPTA